MFFDFNDIAQLRTLFKSMLKKTEVQQMKYKVLNGTKHTKQLTKRE